METRRISEREPVSWVDVRRCNWLYEALVVKSVLDGADIEAVVPDAHTLGVEPAYSALGVRVQVRPADLDRALEVLASAERPSPDSADPDQHRS